MTSANCSGRQAIESRQETITAAQSRSGTACALRLREIERYSVKEWARKAADKYLDDIAAALDRLSENPEILHIEPDLIPGLYFYRVRKHILVCDFQGENVIVLTVIHTSMDLPARLVELEPRLVAESQILQAKPRKTSD